MNLRELFSTEDAATKATMLIISGLLLLLTIAVLIGEGVL